MKYLRAFIKKHGRVFCIKFQSNEKIREIYSSLRDEGIGFLYLSIFLEEERR
jgi:hypothetical protein